MWYCHHSEKIFPYSMDDRYRVLHPLGEGTFSQIFKAVDTYVGKDVAVKVLNHGCELLGRREGQYIQYMNRKNIRGSRYFIKLLDMFYFDDHVCLTLELFKSTLINFIQMPLPPSAPETVFDENVKRPIARSSYAFRTCPSSSGNSHGLNTIDKLRKIALKIISALCLLKKEQIIHADIKPENIFLTWDDTAHVQLQKECALHSTVYNLSDLPENFDVRIGDFGSAIQTSETSEYYELFDIQTLSYRAPEVVLLFLFTPCVVFLYIIRRYPTLSIV